MKKLSKLLIFLLVFSSFFPLAASIRNLDSAQKTHIGVFEEISPDLHLDQNLYITETQQGCNDFCQYDAHRPLYVWYFRARYFSDELGRFVSRDPLGYVDGPSLYIAYFAERFVMDPTGQAQKRNCNRKQIKVDVKLPKIFEKGPKIGIGATAKLGGKMEVDLQQEECEICCKDGTWKKRSRTRGRVRVGLALTVVLGGFIEFNFGPVSVSAYAGLKGEGWGHFSGELDVQDNECTGENFGKKICGVGVFRVRFSGGVMAKARLGWLSLDTGAQVYGQVNYKKPMCFNFDSKGNYTGYSSKPGSWGQIIGYAEGCVFGYCARTQIF